MDTPDSYDASFEHLDDDYSDPAFGWTFIEDVTSWERTSHRHPHAVSEDSDRILSTLAEKGDTSSFACRALRLWHHMGDERVRTHVNGLYLRKHRVSRELIAYCDTPVWVYEFSLMAPAYLEEWNYLCDTNGMDMQADKLTFRLQTRTHDRSGDDAAGDDGAQETMPVELTDDERALVEQTTDIISDPNLRLEAYKAMKSVMEWEKGKTTQQK